MINSSEISSFLNSLYETAKWEGKVAIEKNYIREIVNSDINHAKGETFNERLKEWKKYLKHDHLLHLEDEGVRFVLSDLLPMPKEEELNIRFRPQENPNETLMLVTYTFPTGEIYEVSTRIYQGSIRNPDPRLKNSIAEAKEESRFQVKEALRKKIVEDPKRFIERGFIHPHFFQS